MSENITLPAPAGNAVVIADLRSLYASTIKALTVASAAAKLSHRSFNASGTQLANRLEAASLQGRRDAFDEVFILLGLPVGGGK